jgi:hypothetical protein
VTAERLASGLAIAHTADAGLAGGGSASAASATTEPNEVIMAPRSGAGLRWAMGATLRCANHVSAEALNLGEGS